MKFLSLNEANERIYDLMDRLNKMREVRNRYSDKNLEQSPWANYGKRIAEEQEKVMWDEMREKHPNVVGRAANMAAHNWHITLFEGRVLMLSATGGSYEITNSGDNRYDGPLPKVCVTCIHSKNIHEPRTQVISCALHHERHLKGDVCGDHEPNKAPTS
jgi:hypothetical protein